MDYQWEHHSLYAERDFVHECAEDLRSQSWRRRACRRRTSANQDLGASFQIFVRIWKRRIWKLASRIRKLASRTWMLDASSQSSEASFQDLDASFRDFGSSNKNRSEHDNSNNNVDNFAATRVFLRKWLQRSERGHRIKASTLAALGLAEMHAACSRVPSMTFWTWPRACEVKA